MKKGVLYIVPGWLQTSDFWLRAHTELPEWDVRVIDLPGFGKEPLISKEWGVPEYAEWTRNKITEMRSADAAANNGKTVFLGHSFGGRVLAHMVGSVETEAGEISREKSVDLLILYAAPCLYRPKTSVYLRNKLARMAKKSDLTRLLPHSLKPSDLRQAEDTGMADIFKRTIPYSQENALAQIAVSTELIWGSEDTHVPLPIAKEMQSILPHAHLTVLPGEGHNIHLENPGLFFGTLRKMLDEALRGKPIGVQKEVPCDSSVTRGHGLCEEENKHHEQ